MTDDNAPTQERLSKNRFDQPETDAKRNQRAYISRDQVWEMFRVGDVSQPQYEACRKLERHLQGLLGHDVRVSDFGGDRVDEEAMPQFQLHGLVIAKCRDILTQKEFLSLELLILHDLSPSHIGFRISKYKSREQSKPYALAILQSGLDRLTKHWGLT